MPKHEQIPGERWRRRTPKRIVRWLLRFLAWSSVVTLITVILVAVIAFLVYLNRARFVNDVLARFVAPFDVSVEKIDLYPIGEVSIRNLQLSPKGLDPEEATLEVPEINLSYDFQELRRDRKLKSVLLNSPVIRLDDEALAAMSSPREGKAPSNRPMDFSTFALFTNSFEIDQGKLELDLDGLPKLSGEWGLQTPAFDFDESDMLVSPISIELSDVQLAGDAGKLESISTALRLSRDLTQIEIPFLHLNDLEATITPEWFLRSEKETVHSAPLEDSTGSGPSPNPVQWVIRDITLDNASVSIEKFDGIKSAPLMPDMAFDTGFALDELRFAGGKLTTPGPVSLTLTDIAIGKPGSQLASADALHAEARSIQTVLDHQTFSSIELDGIEVVMTDETLSQCRAAPDAGAQDTANQSEAGKPWIIQTLGINDGRFVMREATFGETRMPHLETALAAGLKDLRFGGRAGFESSELSEIRFSNTRLFPPDASVGVDPLIAFDRAELSGKWSDFNFNNTLERLAIRGPVINFTDETLGSWLTAGDSPQETAGPVNRPVYRVSNLEVTDGKLIADSQFARGKVPKLLSDFSISTDQGENADPFAYQFVLENLRLRNHAIDAVEVASETDPTLFPEEASQASARGINETEVLSVRKVEMSATAEALQRSREISNVKVSGAILRVGEGLKAITGVGEENESVEEAEEPPVADTASVENAELPTWLLREVEITQSQVRFEALIPQVTGLEFAIETKLTDVPLSPDGLLAQDQLQKVELAGIEIKDPYNSFITVAFLPTIFVEFSLAGLAKQEIEKIDLIGPALHVGQGLFWWIDYQRKFREQNEGASVGLDGEDGPIEDKPDWEIKTINANAGKIVIAPTGIPIGMVPFPFNATTNMKDGRIELKLNIPDEDGYVYSFPDYQVNLYGLTGNIEFNVPIQQVSNNIVQVFELDRFVWKDYEAENLYLSVTFDENGVYGELGGEAYEGYAEGGFNFYLNDPGKWDAWVAGTEMDTRPLTEVLVPDNFDMEGLVSLKLVSEGRDKVLGESTGEIQTIGPGWFDITKLDAILETLPEEWNSLQRSLTELGLIALKRFDYDKGAGSLYLLGQEGTLDLRFAGPYGTRELNLHLHDNRNTTPKVTPQTDNPDLTAGGSRAASVDP